MNKNQLEQQGHELLERMSEYQLRFIISLAEKMFLQKGCHA